jgi:hypothetical protein
MAADELLDDRCGEQLLHRVSLRPVHGFRERVDIVQAVHLLRLFVRADP